MSPALLHSPLVEALKDAGRVKGAQSGSRKGDEVQLPQGCTIIGFTDNLALVVVGKEIKEVEAAANAGCGPMWSVAVASQKGLRRKLTIPYKLSALCVISGFKRGSQFTGGNAASRYTCEENRENIRRIAMDDATSLDINRRSERAVSKTT